MALSIDAQPGDALRATVRRVVYVDGDFNTAVGGLLGAMLLTLFVVPCLYLIINRAAFQLRQRMT